MSITNFTSWRSRGYLPHIESSHVIQIITYRLADSLPVHLIQKIKEELSTEGISPQSSYEYMQRLEFRQEKLLNSGYGSCALKDPAIAGIVEETFLFFDTKKYRLLAWVIMPNHIHVMIEPFEGHTLGSIVHSWKSYTALEANKCLGRKGKFWQREYFDRFVRDEEHYVNSSSYIHENPVKAGLVDTPEEWKFSSARLFCD